jgi:NADPH2:quinone reductase
MTHHHHHDHEHDHDHEHHHHHDHHHLGWTRPESMKAVRVNAHGGPEVLQVENIPVPQVQDGQCLVRNAYAGVNIFDTYMRGGLFPVPTPFTIGLESAGIIVETTNLAHEAGFHAGQRVLYYGQESTAEYVVTPFGQLIHIPDEISLSVATSVLIQGFTAHYLTNSTFEVKAGHTILIHAASSGVALFVIKIAKQKGARVIGTVSSDEKAEIARNAGADFVFKYDEDFVSQVKQITQGEGADVVYDSLGLSTWHQSLASAKIRGVVVSFGNATGPVPPINVHELFAKNLSIVAPSLNHYMSTPEEIAWRAREVFDLVRTHGSIITINRYFTLEEVSEAHQVIFSRQTTGKLLIKIRDE